MEKLKEAVTKWADSQISTASLIAEASCEKLPLQIWDTNRHLRHDTLISLIYLIIPHPLFSESGVLWSFSLSVAFKSL